MLATMLFVVAFDNRTALLSARDAWCSDRTAAEATYGPIGDWDVSKITDLSYVFCADANSWAHQDCNTNCQNFNENISNWNTSRVTKLDHTFAHQVYFNQPLDWDTSRVTSFSVSRSSVVCVSFLLQLTVHLIAFAAHLCWNDLL